MNDGSKVKKPLYKRWWVWLLGFVVIIVIVNAGGDSSDSKSPTKNDAPAPATYTLKQEVPAGDLTYTVNSVSKKQTVGNQYFAKTSQAGTYVILNVTVNNTGKDTVTIDSSLFKMTDSEDREFKYSTEGQTALSLSGKSDFFLKQVQPGLSATSDIVFEVPEDATGLQLHVKPGIFSSKEAVIDLE